jgi:hypothetical protein
MLHTLLSFQHSISISVWIQPLASILITCECEHGLNAFNTHLTHCLSGVQRIATHDAIKDIMYTLT